MDPFSVNIFRFLKYLRSVTLLEGTEFDYVEAMISEILLSIADWTLKGMGKFEISVRLIPRIADFINGSLRLYWARLLRVVSASAYQLEKRISKAQFDKIDPIIRWSKQVLPEDYTAELGAKRQRLKAEHLPLWQIRLVLCIHFIEMIWALHIRIKFENLFDGENRIVGSEKDDEY